MSCIVLQIGQCGNQIGNHFWNAIQNSDLNKNCFVLENPRNNLLYYRSINIDTEPKVIKKIVEQKGSPIFRPGCAIAEKCGRGNNWAMGYYNCRLSHTDDIFERALEELRKECERGDNHKVTLMIHSLSGGTGSGVSSRLSEMIKDEIPSRPLIACSVAPFETGDTPMQNYNTLLTLHKLNEQCDAILMLHNDRLMAQLSSGKLTAGKGTNFSDLNALIAENLTGLSLPTNYKASNDFCMLEALIEAMNLNKHKFLLSCSVNEPFRSWNKAVDKLLNFSEPVNTFYATHGKSEKRYNQEHHNGYFLVARGSNNLPLSSEVIHSVNARIREFCRIGISASQQFWESPANISKEKSQSISMTLAYRNNNFMRNYLNKILQSANDQFHVKAYVHWYERFGASIEDFQDSFHYFQTLQKNM